MSEQKRSGLSSFMEKFSSRSSKKAADNKFTYLSEFHTIFIIDDSTSMGGDKWSQVRKVLEEIAPVCTKYDKDGIELHFLNDDEIFTNITSAKRVSKIFDSAHPLGETPIGARLHAILTPYLQMCTIMAYWGGEPRKPVNLIVITDGALTDDLESVLVTIGRRLDHIRADDNQVGVMFCQVGNDQGAYDALVALDNGLKKKYGCRDFVDHLQYEGELTADELLKLVLGAVHRKLDGPSDK